MAASSLNAEQSADRREAKGLVSLACEAALTLPVVDQWIYVSGVTVSEDVP
jgi:hypothetical protein